MTDEKESEHKRDREPHDRTTAAYKNGRDSRDPRVDRYMGFVVNGVAAVAFAVGAWYFQTVSTKLDDLAHQIADLKTQNAVTAVQTAVIEELRREVQHHSDRITKLEAESHPR